MHYCIGQQLMNGLSHFTNEAQKHFLEVTTTDDKECRVTSYNIMYNTSTGFVQVMVTIRH